MSKFIFVLAVALLALIAPAKAQTTTDLLLVLAVDASGSVNQTRFESAEAAAMRRRSAIRGC